MSETPLLSLATEPVPGSCIDMPLTITALASRLIIPSKNLLNATERSSRCRYQMLQSAAESRKIEAQRKKHKARVHKYLTADSSSFACSRNLPTREGGTEDNSQSTGGTESCRSIDSSESSLFWNEESFFASLKQEISVEGAEERGTRDKRDKSPSKDRQDIPALLAMDSTLEDADLVDTSYYLSKRQQKRPTIRLNLARKGNWKYVEDTFELLEWRMVKDKFALYRKTMNDQQCALRTLRSTSKVLKKPLRRGFQTYPDVPSDKIMFSIIHEEEESESDESGIDESTTRSLDAKETLSWKEICLAQLLDEIGVWKEHPFPADTQAASTVVAPSSLGVDELGFPILTEEEMSNEGRFHTGFAPWHSYEPEVILKKRPGSGGAVYVYCV